MSKPFLFTDALLTDAVGVLRHTKYPNYLMALQLLGTGNIL